MKYQAFVDQPETFKDLAQAVRFIKNEYQAISLRDLEVTGVSVIVDRDSTGAAGVVLFDPSDAEAPELQVFVVSIPVILPEGEFTIEYAIECKEIVDGEDGTGEDADGVEPAGSTTPEEPDGGAGEDQSESEAVPSGTSDLGE